MASASAHRGISAEAPGNVAETAGRIALEYTYASKRLVDGAAPAPAGERER